MFNFKKHSEKYIPGEVYYFCNIGPSGAVILQVKFIKWTSAAILNNGIPYRSNMPFEAELINSIAGNRKSKFIQLGSKTMGGEEIFLLNEKEAVDFVFSSKRKL